MGSDECFCLRFDGIYHSVIAVANKSNSVASHAVNVFLAGSVPYPCTLTPCNIYWEPLIKGPQILVFAIHCGTITVQFLCAIAEESGFSTCPEAMIASWTPISSASMHARTFFSMPNPIFDNAAFAWSSVIE